MRCADIHRVEDEWRDQHDARRYVADVIEELVVVADDVPIERVYRGRIATAARVDEVAGESVGDRDGERACDDD